MINITLDKQLHFLASALLIAIFFIATDSIGIAITVTLFIGACKELLWDYLLSKGQSDWYDMLANIIGISAVSIWIVMFKGI